MITDLAAFEVALDTMVLPIGESAIFASLKC